MGSVPTESGLKCVFCDLIDLDCSAHPRGQCKMSQEMASKLVTETLHFIWGLK